MSFLNVSKCSITGILGGHGHLELIQEIDSMYIQCLLPPAGQVQNPGGDWQMEKKEKIWVEFWYRYIDPALFQVLERPKTFEAMERFWDAVSQDELDQLPGSLVVFAPSPTNLGEAIP